MDTKTAWGVLFSKAAPKGKDLDAAAQALDRVDQIDPSEASGLSKEVIDRAEEFLLDPSDFIAQNASDPRVAQWKMLAGTVTPSAPTPTSSRPAAVPPSGTAGASLASAPPPIPAPAVAPTLSVSALRGARVGATAPTLGGLNGELVHERTAATRHETPVTRKKRLDAEAVERQRRLDEGAEERKWVMEEARERRPPEPPPPPKPLWIPSRDIPQVTRRILASAPYLRYSNRIRDVYTQIRDPDPNVSQAGRTKLDKLLRLCKEMAKGTEYLGSMSAVHLESMVVALKANRDLTEPAWFQANYVTGSYTN